VKALDNETIGLLRVAYGIPGAEEPALVETVREARGLGTLALWLEELVLSSVLFVGFPRALVAAAALRQVEPHTGEGADAADYDRWREWQTRGEATGRRIYGENYDKLLRNVAALHPALARWIVVDGYGRTVGRPALDMTRRELCAIAMLVPQDAPRQLHAHLRGALNVGATPPQVEAALALAAGARIAEPRIEAARELWRAVAEARGRERSRSGAPPAQG
jgi:alkylhydroperoxidase/carboxymuconolactone decarboxylase family protein YurZ